MGTQTFASKDELLHLVSQHENAAVTISGDGDTIVLSIPRDDRKFQIEQYKYSHNEWQLRKEETDIFSNAPVESLSYDGRSFAIVVNTALLLKTRGKWLRLPKPEGFKSVRKLAVSGTGNTVVAVYADKHGDTMIVYSLEDWSRPRTTVLRTSYNVSKMVVSYDGLVIGTVVRDQHSSTELVISYIRELTPNAIMYYATKTHLVEVAKPEQRNLTDISVSCNGDRIAVIDNFDVWIYKQRGGRTVAVDKISPRDKPLEVRLSDDGMSLTLVYKDRVDFYSFIKNAWHLEGTAVKKITVDNDDEPEIGDSISKHIWRVNLSGNKLGMLFRRIRIMFYLLFN